MKNTGTTTVGIRCKDSVILAADMRITVGHMIDRGDFDKVYAINDNMALTVAGSVSSVQILIKHLQSQLRLQKIQSGRESTVKEAANLLRNWVYSMIRQPSMMQDISHFIFAGVDKHGVHMYDIFPDGSLTEVPDYKCSGSGSVFAIGVMETQYNHDMTEADGIKLAELAVDTAIQKDSASGNGVNIFVVNKDGVKKVLTKRVNTHLQ